MLKLDSEGRLLISQDVREIAKIQAPCKLYCIYNSGSIVLKQEPLFGTEKVIALVAITHKGRIFVKSQLELAGLDPNGNLLIWAEPGAIHIEQVEGH